MEPIRLTRAQMREVDRLSIEEYGIPGIVLMENAGRAAALLVQELHVPEEPTERTRWRAAVFCGPGQNGGDGFVIARYLHESDLLVECFCSAAQADTRGDARIARDAARKIGVPFHALAGDAQEREARHHLHSSRAPSLVIDALLGTGFSGEPRPEMARAIRLVNELGAGGVPVFAIDVPSGLDCDTGRPADPCVRASQTITFEREKIGFGEAAAQPWLGRVYVAAIGSPRDALDRASGSPRRRLTGR